VQILEIGKISRTRSAKVPSRVRPSEPFRIAHEALPVDSICSSPPESVPASCWRDSQAREAFKHTFNIFVCFMFVLDNKPPIPDISQHGHGAKKSGGPPGLAIPSEMTLLGKGFWQQIRSVVFISPDSTGKARKWREELLSSPRAVLRR
jgi:hypothetical protein